LGIVSIPLVILAVSNAWRIYHLSE
jgi:hypothetical protein